MKLTRRSFLKNLSVLGAAITLRPRFALALSQVPITKFIPVSGEALPVIGMGSSRTFDVGSDPVALEVREKILRTFFDSGGVFIDSSPMYGKSEKVIGYCLDRIRNYQTLFAATKVWILGKDFGIHQMQRSRTLWGVQQFDVIQIHNMLDWETHLETLKEWKATGQIRYIGITTSHGRRHRDLEEALLKENFDFVQFSYNILDREAEKRLLPLAAERNTAVIINRPFQRGQLFSHTEGQPLPEWAREFDCNNWAQFFLKFVVSHPTVTCAIPATSRMDHMQENMGAGFGALPDEKTRQRMIRYFESLI